MEPAWLEDPMDYENAFTLASVVEDEVDNNKVEDKPDGFVEDVLAPPRVRRQLLQILFEGLTRVMRFLLKKSV